MLELTKQMEKENIKRQVQQDTTASLKKNRQEFQEIRQEMDEEIPNIEYSEQDVIELCELEQEDQTTTGQDVEW